MRSFLTLFSVIFLQNIKTVDLHCFCHFVGITFPSRVMQKQLLQEVYSEACIDPATVEYVEAHGTGTKADPEELKAIADVFCTHWFC